MSREDVEVVIRQFEGANAGDFAAVVDAWTEDVTLVAHGDLVGLIGISGDQSVSGKEAVGGWFGDWFRQFASDYRFEVEESRDLGDRVLIVAKHHARGRTSGVPVTMKPGYLYTVRQGKICRVEVWSDRKGALEAAGLQE